ncbi:endonuclease/exonuclease/phosphatase family protein [Halovenus rubra]|uniref:Endonuclease/exonuclease/phosphatase family protein n=2 Tax=Halovenus rubra TaxID=869890 RepID=A0ACC7E448_9EURY|nr:endonuclease/exonuclease/phosphatase family protein [Halovenus rubra]
MKLLSCNAGYLLDYEGSYHEYVLRPHRGLIGSKRAEENALSQLVDVINDEQPDVVGLVEVDQGSLRTRTDGQVADIARRLRERGLTYHPQAATKYGSGGVIPSLPMLQHLANGVLSTADHETVVHYLETGPKRLVIEVSTPEVDIFSTHLAMSGRARRSQLQELAELVTARENPVVAGDFNTYNGLDEVEAVFDGTELTVYEPGETVPPRPLDTVVTDTRTLDFFIAPESMAVSRCDVLDVQVSDHRPIVMEFEP